MFVVFYVYDDLRLDEIVCLVDIDALLTIIV